MATLAEYNALFKIHVVTSGDKEMDKVIDRFKEADIASGRVTRSMAEQAAEAKKLAYANKEVKDAQEAVNKSVEDATKTNTKASTAVGKVEQQVKGAAAALKDKDKAVKKGGAGLLKYAKIAGVVGTALFILGKALSKTRVGIESMERVSGAGSFAMTLLGNSIVDAGRSIGNSVSSGGFWQKTKKFFIQDFLPGIIKLSPTVADAFNRFIVPLVENDKLIKAQQALSRERAKFLPIQAKYEAQLKDINTRLKDQNLSGVEAEKLRQRAVGTQSILDQKQLDFAKESLRIIKERNANQGAIGENLTPQQILEEGKAEAAVSALKSKAATARLAESIRQLAIDKEVGKNLEELNKALDRYTDPARIAELDRQEQELITAANERTKALVGDPEQVKEQAEKIREILKIEIARLYSDELYTFGEPKLLETAVSKMMVKLQANLDRILKQDKFKMDLSVAPEVEFDTDPIELGKKAARVQRRIDRAYADAQDGEVAQSPLSRMLGLDSDTEKAVNEALEGVKNATEIIFGEQVRRADTEIQIQRDKIAFLGSLQEGATDEQLRLEQTRLEKLTKEREKAARNQQKVASIEIAANSALAVSNAILAITEGFTGPGALIQGIATAVTLAAAVVSTIAAVSSAFQSIPAFYTGRNPEDGIDSVGYGTMDSRGGSLAVIHPNEMVVPGAITSHPAMQGVGYADLPHYVALGKAAAANRREVNTPDQAKAANDQRVLRKLLSEQEYTNYLQRRRQSNILIDAGGIREIISSKDGAMKRVERAFY